jgi:cobalamin 5'-phosphate synthase/cobalamin synthase
LIAQFAAAVSFLTRLPAGRNAAFDGKDVARSSRWFPLVGGLLGGISVGAFWLLSRVFPPLVAAVLIVAIDAILTGALHFDGLADTADGFGGGRTRADVLRIMRDHAIGSYGGVALVLVIALKVAAIATLADSRRAVPGLLLAPVLGRWSAVISSSTEPYARPPEDDGPNSVGSPARFVGRRELMIATVTAAFLAAAAGRWFGAAALLLVAVASICWGWCCRRRIGGVTGDTLGAGIEMSECLVLLLFTGVR